ncbi:MAG: hypothetical protein QOI80_57 [Solirubrobacteraceae bacterium]|jgi:hypothetical protein|nr:hypothetical protein [Solirubrobacteraceae bacterium]
MRRIAVIAAVTGITACVGAAGAGGATGGLPQGSDHVELDPADFTTKITNPYWPMRPGSSWRFRETTPGGRPSKVVIKVTSRTKQMPNGVTARVVRDTHTEHGTLVEDTFDYYAQDSHGNIWYLGELSKQYEHGKFKRSAGSFEAGAGGAEAGIAIPAAPVRGLKYRHEYLQGEAEDRASVISLHEQVGVPAGHYSDVLMTRDDNPVDPRVLEYKFFARGVGPVLEFGVSGGNDRTDLVRFRRGRR